MTRERGTSVGRFLKECYNEAVDILEEHRSRQFNDRNRTVFNIKLYFRLPSAYWDWIDEGEDEAEKQERAEFADSAFAVQCEMWREDFMGELPERIGAENVWWQTAHSAQGTRRGWYTTGRSGGWLSLPLLEVDEWGNEWECMRGTLENARAVQLVQDAVDETVRNCVAYLEDESEHGFLANLQEQYEIFTGASEDCVLPS